MQAERALYDAHVRADTAMLESLVAPDFTDMEVGLFRDRRASIDWAHANERRVLKAEMREPNVRVLGDLAIVTGRRYVVTSLTAARQQHAGEYLFTDVWRRSGSKWQLTASAVTPTAAQQRLDAKQPKASRPAAFRPASEVFASLGNAPRPLAAEIHSVEHSLNEASVRRDTAVASRYFDNGLTDIWEDGGAHGKQQDLETLVKDSFSFIEFTGELVRSWDNVAVFMATVHQAGTYKGHQFDEYLIGMDVWNREAGRWRLVASQQEQRARQSK
jgi:hypothetical protein